jgi:hypothetical protein
MHLVVLLLSSSEQVVAEFALLGTVCVLLTVAPSRLYCGHGPAVGSLNDHEDSPVSGDAIAKIDEYVKHRLEREATILAILEVMALMSHVIVSLASVVFILLLMRTGFPNAAVPTQSCHPEPMSARMVTEKIYPTEGVSGTLLLAAARSVLLHVLKVKRAFPGFSCCCCCHNCHAC